MSMNDLGGLARDKSLLDEFAGLVFVTCLQGVDASCEASRERCARDAYDCAAAMLAERERRWKEQP